MSLSSPVWVAVAGLFFFVGKGDGLQCYRCLSEFGLELCKHAPLTECEANSNCVTANFTFAEPNEHHTMLSFSCKQKHYKDEDICNTFKETMRDLAPSPEEFEKYAHITCELCTTDGCNRPKNHVGSASRNTLSTLLFAGTLGCALSTSLHSFK